MPPRDFAFLSEISAGGGGGGEVCLNHTVQKGQPRSTRNEFPIRVDITLRAEATFSRYELMSHAAKM